MANVVNDPEELRDFANALQNYIDTLDEETGKIHGQYTQLADFWQDGKFSQFQEEFESLLSKMKSFEETAKEQLPRLHKMADFLEDYNNV